MMWVYNLYIKISMHTHNKQVKDDALRGFVALRSSSVYFCTQDVKL